MTAKYVIRDAEGKLLRTVICPEDQLAVQLQEGETATEETDDADVSGADGTDG